MEAASAHAALWLDGAGRSDIVGNPLQLPMTKSAAFATALLALGALPPSFAQTASTHLPNPSGVSARGRLEPEHGVLRIAAPSTPDAVSGSIVRTIRVEVGDDVAEGDLLATTDTTAPLEAKTRAAAAEVRVTESAARAAGSRADQACALSSVAEREAERRQQLVTEGVISAEESETSSGAAIASAAACASAEAETKVAQAEVERARARRAVGDAELERSRIKAPSAGRVLAIHARPGELVGAEGLLDLGRVDRMYAVAEVYETEIRAVKIGQRATVTSEALAAPLAGRVERIRPRVRKQDVVGTDPAARKDARIIEVEILLDDSSAAANLTHLQVDVVIQTGS